MASIRDLKKDINYVLGDIIEAVYQWEAATGNKNSQQGTALIDKAIEIFDNLMILVNQKKVVNKQVHFKSIRTQLEAEATSLVEGVNALS